MDLVTCTVAFSHLLSSPSSSSSSWSSPSLLFGLLLSDSCCFVNQSYKSLLQNCIFMVCCNTIHMDTDYDCIFLLLFGVLLNMNFCLHLRFVDHFNIYNERCPQMVCNQFRQKTYTTMPWLVTETLWIFELDLNIFFLKWGPQ